jgi:hypothetical protein
VTRNTDIGSYGNNYWNENNLNTLAHTQPIPEVLPATKSVEYNVGYAPDDIGYLGMAKRVEIRPKEGYRPVRATPKRLKARYISQS